MASNASVVLTSDLPVRFTKASSLFGMLVIVLWNEKQKYHKLQTEKELQLVGK
jgi:hypothetical protein